MPKLAKKVLTTLTLLAGVFFVYHFVFAQTDLGLSYGAATGLSNTDPRIIAARIIQIFLGLLGTIALGLIIYAGFLWMTAAGNEEKIDQAKKILVSAVIGLAIILSAFGIATFILNSLLGAVNPGVGQNDNGGNGGGGGVPGSGAVGACSVQNTYPSINQTGVSRNTAIMVTFDQAVNPAGLCASANCLVSSPINMTNVQIYKTSDGNVAATNLSGQVTATADNKTFIFIPSAPLGVETEGDNIQYSVNISGVKTASGADIFGSSGCPNSLNWQFTVAGGLIDLTPPQVSVGGVFPPPDSGADTSNGVLPAQALGSITVNAQPKVFAAATANVTPTNSGSGTPSATITNIDPSIDTDAVIDVAVSADGSRATAQAGALDLGAVVFSGSSVTFSGKYSFTLNSSQTPKPGWEWTVTITAGHAADSLSVGSGVYTFVTSASAGNQIALGANPAGTAQNIAAVLTANNSSISVISNAGTKINLGAAQAGAAGNNIILSSTAADAVLHFVPLAGGSDGNDGSTTIGNPDQPMNTVIQINFNKSILPSTVVGANGTVKGIEVVDSAGLPVGGKFVIANQYKTAEFISNTACGVNGCGETIYCLPAKSHLTVKINAASLATCASAASCPSAFNICNTFCKNSSGINYPTAQIPVVNGVSDASLNSLDGNRDGNAQGPVSFYDENVKAAATGDNYQWSFYISDKIDATPPTVLSTFPAVGSPSQSADQDIKINFSKLMMASSLITGSTISDNGQGQLVNKNLNIWSPSGNSVGYWIQTETISANGIPNATNAIIKHSTFGESLKYNAQAGSGVEDIHQNCFKPSGNCVGVSKNSPSCCDGTATSKLGVDGNCP
jgi:hypothetical protein